MNNIHFSHNWNRKLNCPVHTTIRLRNEQKYKAGKRCRELGPDNQDLGVVEIIDIKYIRIDQLNEFIARIDTGYSVDETKDILYRMYKKKNIDWSRQQFAFMLLKRVEPEQKSIEL